ncbi:ATP-binding cassette domain-containing protein [Chloroflexi bacterium TSY]|nr:ATP-binding cassette domain-containing protein [Chloroflexi bacterium TSY]
MNHPNKLPIYVADLTVSFGTQTVLHEVDFSLGSNSRVVLIGPNGAGKSTLLKILAGYETPDAGYLDIAKSVVLGYLDQEQETLNSQSTLFEAFRGNRVGEWEELKAELLRYGLFRYEDLSKSATTLSIGQQRKLQIAQLIGQRANILLLDEPTNHISLDVLEQFEQALLNFRGAIIAISHDRHFIERFTRDEELSEIWELEHGQLKRYLGGWQRYQELKQKLIN